MSSKKLPARSKIIITTVGLLAALYLLIVGFSYLKTVQEFKPYTRLANDLKTEVGGDFLTSNTMSCDIDVPDCPSVHSVKSQILISTEAQAFIKQYSKLLQFKGFKDIVLGDCSDEGLNYCRVSGVESKSGLSAVISLHKDTLRIDVGRP